MKKNLFTLVELLIVIAIIGILSAIIIPALNGATEKAEATKAKAGITTLYNAIKQYESTYGVLPIPSGYKQSEHYIGQNDTKGEEMYKWLILLLQGEEISASSNSDLKGYGVSAKYNKRNVSFLEVVGSTPGEYLDPWDANYFVFFDDDYDGKIKDDIPGLNKAKDSKGNTQPYRYSVVVASRGPDSKLSETNSNSANKDNLYSMSTTLGSEGHNQDK